MKNCIESAASDRGLGLRIGVDARLLGERPTGIGHYISELSGELAGLLPGAEFFMYAPWPIEMPVKSSRWHLRVDPWGKAFERLRSLWITRHAWMLLRTRSLCLQDRINVFWATDAPFIPLLPKEVRIVAAVHDLRYCVAPKTQRVATLYARRLLEKRHARADVLVANSNGTAAKLHQLIGYKATAIVRPAISAKFYHRTETEITDLLLRYGIPRPYILSIANADATPHKNIAQLIRVFSELTQDAHLEKHSLVLGGPRSVELLEDFSRKSGHRSNVLALGYVNGDDLPALYSGAEVFVFPSFYEGFGIPVLEARACNTRIVTTDTPELREAGGAQAVYIKPDAHGIRNGILAALKAAPPAIPETLWTWRSSAKILADALAPSE